MPTTKNHHEPQLKQKSYFLQTLKQNMQNESKTMGDFVAPGKNAPLVRASFELHNGGTPHKKQLHKPRGCGLPTLQIASGELLQVFPLQSKKRTYT